MTNWRVLVPIGIAAALWILGIVRLDVPGDFGQSSAANRPCHPTVAEVAVTEIAGGPLGVPTPTPVAYPIVTIELVALAGDRDVPTLLPSLVVRAPVAEQSDVRAFLDAAPADLTESAAADDLDLEMKNAYRSLLSDLLANDPNDADDIGLLPVSTEKEAQDALRDALDIDQPPLIGVGQNGTITLVIPQSPKILVDNKDLAASGWSVSSSGRDITFRFTGDPDAKTAWHIGVCTDGLPIVSARRTTKLHSNVRSSRIPPPPPPRPSPVATHTPNPTSHGLLVMPTSATTPTPPAIPGPSLQSHTANNVQWWFPRTTTPADSEGVEVVVQASPLGAVRMWMFSDWRTLVVPTVAYALPAGLLLVGLRLVLRSRAVGLEYAKEKARLVAITWAVVRLTIAAVLSLFVATSYTAQWNAAISQAWNTSVAQFDKLASAVPLNGPILPVVINDLIPRTWIQQGFLLLLLTFVASAVIGLGFLDHPGPRGATEDRLWKELVLAVVIVLATGASVAYVFKNVNVRLDSQRFLLINPALLVTGYTMFLVTAVHVWWQRADRPVRPGLRLALPAVGAISLFLCISRFEIKRAFPSWNQSLQDGILPLWVTCCVVVGFVLLADVLLRAEREVSKVPARLNDAQCTISRLKNRRAELTREEAPAAPVRIQWIDQELANVTMMANKLEAARDKESVHVPRRAKGTGRIALSVYVIVFIVIILVQWEWANYSQLNIWWRIPVETDPVRHFPVVSDTRLSETLLSYIPTFLDATLDILLILGLASFVGVLRGTAQCSRSPFWGEHEDWIKWLLVGLFAALVVGYGGQVLGLRAPVAFVFGLFLLSLTLSHDVESESNQIDRDHHRDRDEVPLIMAYRGGLLRSALARVGIEHAPAVRDAALPFKLTRGDRHAALALALGPERGWWSNGLVAVRLGTWLAILPIAYFLYVFLNSHGAGTWSLGTPFAIVGLVSALTYEVAFWLVAAFAFGCLYPYLRGQNGLFKGMALAAVYIGANAAAALLGIPGNALWQVRSFQLLLFLMLLGAWFDLKSLEAEGASWRELVALYELSNATNLARQVLPLVIALAGVVVQLYSRQTQEATENLISGEASQAILDFLCKLTNCG